MKIRINTREKNLALNVGDKIEVRCNILPPPRPMLPWGFDFSRHAYFKQIGAVGYATGKVRVLSKSQRHQNEQQDALYVDDKLNDEALFGEHDVQFKEVEEELYEKLAFGHGIFIELVVFVNKVRAKIVGILSSHMQKRTAGVASGLLVGDASSITDSDFKALRIAGIAHIIAISGMHIVLISTILFISTRFIIIRILVIQARFAAYQHKKSRDIKAESNLNNKNGKYTRIAIFEVVVTYYSDKIAAFISMIGSAMYLVLAGMPVSGQRALVVSYIFLIGIIIDRKPNALNSLCIGASLILLFQPEAIFSPSLQMSLSACLGLIVCYRFLGKFLFINLKQKNYVKRVFFYLLNITVSTLAAGLATAPFIIYHFHQFSTYSVIANLGIANQE